MEQSDRNQVIRRAFDADIELNLSNVSYRDYFGDFFSRMMDEDIGKGDASLTPEQSYETTQKARIIAKSSAVIAGLNETIFFLLSRKELTATSPFKNGDTIEAGNVLLHIEGKAAEIITVERTILNILQRLSGIATLTKKYTDLIAHTNCSVAATRKTFWGLLDKRAVQCGGGLTHRLSLYDAAMLKENHIAILKKSVGNQTIRSSIQKILKKYDNLRFIEVEVTSDDEFREIVNIFNSIKTEVPKVIMFDHFSPDKITELIEELKSRNLYDQILLEASGNISLKTIKSYAESGVDIISVGALTHSAPSMDYSLIFD